jgi:hypothetical protein
MAEFVAAKSGETEQQWRQFMAYLFAQSSTGKATTGVLTGLGVTQTTTASASVVVGAGLGTVQAATNDGVSPVVTTSAKTLDVLTANPVGGLPRNDIIVWDSASGASAVIIGTPAATPSDPTVPTSAIPLARIRNAASATTIPSSAIDDLRTFTRLFGVSASEPYAQAAGSWTPPNQAAGNTSTQHVTFPAGRFTVAPLVTVAAGSSRLTIAAASITSTGFDLQSSNWTSAASTGAPISWHAVQMTSTSASG